MDKFNPPKEEPKELKLYERPSTWFFTLTVLFLFLGIGTDNLCMVIGSITTSLLFKDFSETETLVFAKWKR